MRAIFVFVLSVGFLISTAQSLDYLQPNKVSPKDNLTFVLIKNIPDDLPIVRRLGKNAAIVRGSVLGEKYSYSEVYEINDLWKLSDKKNYKKSKKFYISTVKSLKNVSGLTEIFYDERRNISLIETNSRTIDQNVIGLPYVTYIQPADRVPKEESILRNHNLGINGIRSVHRDNPDWNAGGFSVSVKEGAMDTLDIDVGARSQLDELSSPQVTSHATDMATLIAGGGNSSVEGRGVAKGVELYSENFNELLPAQNVEFENRGVTVQNHSYGVGVENFYGVESVAFDQQSIDIPELLHVFSAGNSGDKSGTGDYAGIERFGTLTGSFKQAKNVLLVNGTDDFGHVSEFNSAGPAYDGRVKPEISAFGDGGTSDAAALVSGAVLVLQDAFKVNNVNTPSSDMIKALLIAGSDDILNPGPDFVSGYGQLNLKKSIEVVENDWWAAGEITDANDEMVFAITIDSDVSKIQFALVWRDPPTNNGDDFALINDLDFQVVTLDASEWNPWILDSSPNVISLNSNATTGEDHLNNVEFITIENPTAGDYSLKVSATSLSSSQPFSIAYHIQSAGAFEWLYPTHLDPQESESEISLYFENTFSSSGTISYDDLSGNWITLGTVEPGEKQMTVSTPAGTNEIVLRAAFGADEIKSDTFSIHSKSEINVSLLCDTELVLSWQPIENADGYELLKYLDGGLGTVTVQADTFAILDRNTNPSLYYTVRPVFENSAGRPDETIRVDRQAVGCYLNNFLVSLNTNGTVFLEADLSLPSRISSFRILKTDLKDSTVLVDLNPTTNILQHIDSDLEPGKTSYQVQLLTEAGEILSEKVSLFTTDERKYILFPNPVVDGEIAFLSPVTSATFQILDTSGRPLEEFLISAEFEVFPVTHSKGVYLYRVIKDEKVVNSGRFVIGSSRN